VPSRKQRRRRAKLQRHEYEYVVETEEGEVPLERPRETKDGREGGRDGERAAGAVVDRRGRAAQKPTMARVLRRAAIFAPIMAIFVYIVNGDELSPVAVAVNTLILIAFFIPFSYLVDTLVYRTISRRAERERTERRGR
jgi:hypothetical protein